MTDSYTRLVNTGLTKTLASKLGLPRPAVLRRYRPGDALTVGPVLVLSDAASKPDADAVAQALLGWDLDVRREPTDDARWGAVVLVLTAAERPTDVSDAVLALGSVLRRLAPNGRVVTVSRAATDDDGPELAATRHGVEGLLRSLAKELRAGATGNGVVLTGGAAADSTSALATLRFFLSARSAFVDGQLLPVGPSPDAGDPGPADPRQPLTGQVAVVTGAARGIGVSIAKVLAREGATVVCVDVAAAGEGLARTANAVGGTALQLDVTAEDAGTRILEHARSRHGRLDVVVHNAGILRDKLLANMRPEHWDAVVAVNLAAQLRINAQLVEAGVEGLRIVSLASIAGIAGNRGQTNYGFSKAGVIGHTRATAPLVARLGGTANAVAPGFIETEMTRSIPALTRELGRRASSLQQGGLPVDVAEAVAFLASPAAAGVNGEVLRVCGQSWLGR
ncbi:3-oxoacyl-ACP reductase [Isoptericola variabilis]|uniref:3-oxoacyl-(Acyl-carrier-protein) reductase n=1 Tax=Isoptericola variabilis (strain 225) TaxID=743718 RepID=F6FSZ1_ISOV2|nr:3-oxoacyl-ACP reductase [Isoptericola variabilis]AEG43132.1 3-oxoacyl-(acyl-carrier-protein) reductase [Isoptericola variabilis 225]TWH35063.1 3-oxoacyl-[acyl-carrier protein] reductase [Isoptericola variabilis J7]